MISEALAPSRRPTFGRQSITILLLAFGLAAWIGMGGLAAVSLVQWIVLTAAVCLAILPTSHNAILRSIGQLNRRLEKRPLAIAACITLIGLVGLLMHASYIASRLNLKLSDEHAYLIQAHMLAGGRLWVGAYPPDVAPFFDNFYLITDRVYAPMYFPGTALLLVPGVWLGLPPWVMPMIAGALCLGWIFLIAGEMFDPFVGCLAALLLFCMPLFAPFALTQLSEIPFLLAEVILIWTWLRFRKRPGWRWALGMGAAAGYAAITRPVDAICFALPIGVAICWQLRHRGKLLAQSLLAIILTAAPFLAVLILQNIGVSGRWNMLAESYYFQENLPAQPFGFPRIDPTRTLRLENPAKQAILEQWVLPSFARHTLHNALRSWWRGRLPQMLIDGLGLSPLLILLPLVVLEVHEQRRAVMLLALFLFMLGYALSLFQLNHYVVAALVVLTILVLMGAQALGNAWPRQGLGLFAALAVIAWSLTTLPSMWGTLAPDPNIVPDEQAADRLLSQLSVGRALVLFRFDPQVGNDGGAPVYNDTVARPDDARIVRAWDRGPLNLRLIKYYADFQPDRVLYLYDPHRRLLGLPPLSGPLGTVAQLARNQP